MLIVNFHTAFNTISTHKMASLYDTALYLKKKEKKTHTEDQNLMFVHLQAVRS